MAVQCRLCIETCDRVHFIRNSIIIIADNYDKRLLLFIIKYTRHGVETVVGIAILNPVFPCGIQIFTVNPFFKTTFESGNIIRMDLPVCLFHAADRIIFFHAKIIHRPFGPPGDSGPKVCNGKIWFFGKRGDRFYHIWKKPVDLFPEKLFMIVSFIVFHSFSPIDIRTHVFSQCTRNQ